MEFHPASAFPNPEVTAMVTRDYRILYNIDRLKVAPDYELCEIGYIKSSIDRIEKNLDKLEERYSVLSNKIVKVEESVAQEIKESLNTLVI